MELLPGSERMSFDEKKQIHSLGGNVSFIYQGNTMYCDSAVYFQKTNYVKAYGNVHINKEGSINIFSDSLWFDGNRDVGFLWGNVRARDQEYKLTTDSLEYQAKEGKAIYRHGGKVESNYNKEVLTSKIGYFYPEKKDFFFKTNVEYKSEETVMTTDTLQYNYLKKKISFFGPTTLIQDSTIIKCERGWYKTDTEEAQLTKNAQIFKKNQQIFGDTLLFNPNKKTYIGFGNIVIYDTTQRFSLFGDYMYKNDSTYQMFITKNAYAFQEKDSLFIHADTLFGVSDSTNEIVGLKGFYGVRFYQKDIQGQCDSITYFRQTDRLEMYNSPVLWTKKGELKADSIQVQFKDSLIDRAYLYRNSSAIFELDTGSYFNQVAGKNILALFKNNEIYRTDVSGNAQTIYFPESTEKSDTATIIKRTGMNRLFASDLRVYLDSGEVTAITYLDQPDGKFYPMDQIETKDKKITNFNWSYAQRPKNWEEIFIDPKLFLIDSSSN
ncbi:MAG: hypothetical protein KJ941_02950 [Bacteroidetes bacterium]|nr:hypothetical protein [Bacteroidota bacterium]